MKSLGIPELDLLILASREASPCDLQERAIALAEQCRNRDFFIRACIAHKTVPLVGEFLKTHSLGEVSDFFEAVEIAVMSYCERLWIPAYNRINGTLATVRATLNAHSIPFIALRGTAFASRYYRHPVQRVSRDIDLLVPEDSVSQCESVFLSNGFHHTKNRLFCDAKRTYVGQVELMHGSTNVSLDLNWRLTANGQTGGISRDSALVWERATCIAGNEYVLAPEDMLLHLIRHVAQGHDFESGIIQCCCDVQALLRHSAHIDGDYVRREALACGCERALHLFAAFHESFYRDASQAALHDTLGWPLLEHGDNNGRAVPVVNDAFCERSIDRRQRWHNSAEQLFLKWCVVSQLRIAGRLDSCVGGYYRENLRLLAKLWAADSLYNVWLMLRIVLWPTKPQVVLLARGAQGQSISGMRAAAYAMFLFGLSPGLFAGLLARMVLPLGRCKSKPAHRKKTKPRA